MALTKQQLNEINTLARQSEQIQSAIVKLNNVIASPSEDNLSILGELLPHMPLNVSQITYLANQMKNVAQTELDTNLNRITEICYDASTGYTRGGF